jgi:hypothetical protein
VRFTARVFAGIMLAAGGFVHFVLWQDGYQGIPYIGTLFVANVVASVVVALALVATGDRRVALAAAVLSVTSLGALVLSRTTGLLGFTETAWTREALQAVAAEIGVLAAIGLRLATARRAVLVPARIGR